MALKHHDQSCRLQSRLFPIRSGSQSREGGSGTSPPGRVLPPRLKPPHLAIVLFRFWIGLRTSSRDGSPVHVAAVRPATLRAVASDGWSPAAGDGAADFSVCSAPTSPAPRPRSWCGRRWDRRRHRAAPAGARPRAASTNRGWSADTACRTASDRVAASSLNSFTYSSTFSGPSFSRSIISRVVEPFVEQHLLQPDREALRILARVDRRAAAALAVAVRRRAGPPPAGV